jgi:hypothetical protein
MRSQLRGSDVYPGGLIPTEHISLLLDMRVSALPPLAEEKGSSEMRIMV